VLYPASRTLNAFYLIWRDFGFVPEEFDFGQWKVPEGVGKGRYPLRPELAESTMYMFQVRVWPRARCTCSR
jgi:mannosidase alpha-like ER degradation enhancer 2